MTVRFGILGAAKFAREHMGPAIHAARGCELVALGSTSGRGLDWHPTLRVHASYEAVLDDPEVDAVYIPLPNHLHVEWAVRAARAGKHVLVEKPAARDASEFARLIEARESSGKMVAEAFMIVHHPQWQAAKRLLSQGAIGRLHQIDARFSFRNTDGGNIRNRVETGGGALPDIGVYIFGGPRFATGAEPVRLDARIEYENGVDTFARIDAEMDGPLGTVGYSGFVSTRLHNRQEVVFHGEEGVITLPVPFNARVFGQAELRIARGMDVLTERWPAVNQYVLQVEAFAEAVRDGGTYFPDLEFSRGTQAMIDACYAASPRPA